MKHSSTSEKNILNKDNCMWVEKVEETEKCTCEDSDFVAGG